MQLQTDSDLIAAYAHSGDQKAFAELVLRHQRMVYRVCQRMLGHHQEAEDATQAVFLVMLHKANGLTRKGELTGWLYGVARNVALEALRKRGRRKEEAMLDETEAVAAEDSPDHEAALQSLDRELAGLSGVLRQAVVLRYLQGYDQAEAARQAGCSMGTLASRASRGIERLRQRLAKRGVALSGAALAGLLTSEASAAVPETLLPTILATVKTVAAGAATTGATSTAAMLAKGATKAMFIAKVKMVAAVAAVVIVTGTAVPVGIAVAQAVGKEEESPARKTDVDAMLKQAQDLLSQGKKADANGDASLGQKQYKAAADLFLQVQKEYEAHPLAPRALLLAGQCQMRMKDDKAAIQTLETLLQTYPDAKTIRPEALYWLGDCYSRTKDPAAAKRVWEKLNSEFPESNWGKYARGRLSPDHGFIALSPRPDYEVPDYPTNSLPEAEAKLQGEADKHFAKKEPKEYELAAAAYDSLVLKYPKSKAVPYALVRKGRSLQFVGKRSEAIKIYGGVLEYYPDSTSYAAPALLYLAQCHYLNKGNVSEEATKAIAQLRADKDYGKHEAAACATFLLAHMQVDGGKTDEAIATLGAIAVPFPAYAALAQLRQAEVYEKAGKTAEAIAAYRATMTKYPGTPESTLAHNALEKMGSRSPDATHVALTGKAAEIEKKAQEAKVTLSIKEMTADNALDRLSKSGITIRKTDIPKDAKISLEMRDASVLDGVKRVTEMLGLTYVIVDDAIEVSGKR